MDGAALMGRAAGGQKGKEKPPKNPEKEKEAKQASGLQTCAQSQVNLPAIALYLIICMPCFRSFRKRRSAGARLY